MPVAILLLVFGAFLGAAPISFDVICDGMTVGAVSVDVSGTGVSGGFTSTFGGPPPTLAAAAAKCGEHHFNWYQIVTADNMPPNDSDGNPLGPPYVDPPPGGYSNQWADSVPWYWDEYVPPAGTPNVDLNLQLSAQTTADMLKFADFPGGAAGTDLMFKTWLVSLNADSSFHSWHGGFSWDWSNSVDKNGVASNVTALNATPTQAEYDNLIRGFATSVPEPATYLLASIGLFLVGLGSRMRRS